MKGDIFNTMLNAGFFESSNNLRPDSELNDLETLYTLLLEARNKDEKNLVAYDELLALAILCRIGWPGKSARYATSIRTFLSFFEGISRSRDLRERFSMTITPNYKNLVTGSRFDLSRVRNVFDRGISGY